MKAVETKYILTIVLYFIDGDEYACQLPFKSIKAFLKAKKQLQMNCERLSFLDKVLAVEELGFGLHHWDTELVANHRNKILTEAK